VGIFGATSTVFDRKENHHAIFQILFFSLAEGLPFVDEGKVPEQVEIMCGMICVAEPLEGLFQTQALPL